MSLDSTARPTFLSRSLKGLLIIVLPLLALLYSCAMIASYWAFNDFLKRHQLTGELGYIELTPRLSKLHLKNVYGQNVDGQGFAVDELILDIQFWPLLDNRLVLENLTINAGQVDLRLLPEGLQLGGIWLYYNERLKSDQNTPSATPPEVNDTPQTSAWQMEIQQVELIDSRICAEQLDTQEQSVFSHCLTAERLALAAELSITSLAPLALDVDGQLSLDGLAINDQIIQRRALSFSHLSLQQLAFNLGQVSIGQLELGGLSFAERIVDTREYQKYRYHSELGRLSFNGLLLELARPEVPLAVTINAINLADLNLLIYRDQQVRLPMLQMIDHLLMRDRSALSENTDEQSNPSHPHIRIEQLTLAGDSDIEIIDESITPNLVQRISDLTINIGAADNQNITTDTPFELSAKVGEFGAITLKGHGQPFNPKVNSQVSGQLSAMNVLPYSPYSENSVGYKVLRGQINNQLTLNIVDDQIEAEAQFKLQKLAIESLKPEEQTDSSGETLLPLGLALKLLQDSDGNIELNIPVSGDVSDPNFNLTDAALLVGRKVLTQAVVNYYTPFGLVNLGTFVAGEAMKLRFEPMVYDGGKSQPNRTQLTQLTELLTAKPQLSIITCPNATGADLLALNAGVPLAIEQITEQHKSQLTALAQERAQALKGALINNGVNSEQVIVCAPELQITEAGLASTTIEI